MTPSETASGLTDPPALGASGANATPARTTRAGPNRSGPTPTEATPAEATRSPTSRSGRGSRLGKEAPSQPARQRRPQARALATRARLLETAQKLFTRQGEEATTMQDIATGAGVGVGTVYHHFSDKRALLLELIDQYGNAVAARRRTELELATFLGDDARGAVQRWLLRAYERLRTQPSLYLVILALAQRDAEVRERYRRIEELAIERLCSLIEFAQARGIARPDVAPAAAAFLIHHAIDMAAMQLLVHDRSETDPEKVLRELADMICRYILEETR